jgi:hypothetical protein
MAIGVKMKPVSVIKARLGIEPNGRIQKFFTSECAKTMDKYVPYDEGNLADYIIEGNLIIYQQPYAHYMYEGKVMGPNIPIKEDGIITGWFSPKDKAKHYTGKDIDYSKSKARGHNFAGPHWDRRMWSAEKDNIVKRVQNEINRGGH